MRVSVRVRVRLSCPQPYLNQGSVTAHDTRREEEEDDADVRWLAPCEEVHLARSPAAASSPRGVNQRTAAQHGVVDRLVEVGVQGQEVGV